MHLSFIYFPNGSSIMAYAHWGPASACCGAGAVGDDTYAVGSCPPGVGKEHQALWASV